MPTRTFTSFEAFFAANLHSDLRGMVLGRRRENWVMTQLLINHLSFQWGRAGSSVVVEGAAKPGGVSIFYAPANDRVVIRCNGLESGSVDSSEVEQTYCEHGQPVPAPPEGCPTHPVPNPIHRHEP